MEKVERMENMIISTIPTIEIFQDCVYQLGQEKIISAIKIKEVDNNEVFNDPEFVNLCLRAF